MALGREIRGWGPGRVKMVAKDHSVRISSIFAVISFSVVVFWWASQPGPGYFQRAFVARAAADVADHHLRVSIQSPAPGVEPFLVIAQTVSGMQFVDVMLLPVGIAGRGLFAYLIVRSVTRRRLISAAMALMMVLYPWFLYSYSNIHIHALGSLAILFIVFLAYRIDEAPVTPKRHLSVLLVVAFPLIHLVDYTTQVWAILLFGFLGISAAMEKFRWGVPYFAAGFSLGLAYLWKNTTAAFFAFVEEFHNPIDVLFGYFLQSEATIGAYQYSPPSRGLTTTRAFHILAISAIVTYAIIKGYRVLRTRSFSWQQHERVTVCLLTAGVTGSGFYFLIGRPTQFFLALFGAPLAILVLHHIQQSEWKYAGLGRPALVLAVGLFTLTAGAGFGIYHTTDQIQKTSDTTFEPATGFLVSTAEAESLRVLTGLQTEGRLQTTAIGKPQSFSYIRYNLSHYRDVVTGDSPATDYVIVDYGGQRGVQSLKWNRFENLDKHRENVNANHHLNKVFTSGEMTIYEVG